MWFSEVLIFFFDLMGIRTYVDLKELRNYLHFSSCARARASFFDRSALDLQVSNHLHGWNKLRKEGNDVSSIYKQSFIRHAILSGISHHFLMNHQQFSFLIFWKCVLQKAFWFQLEQNLSKALTRLYLYFNGTEYRVVNLFEASFNFRYGTKSGVDIQVLLSKIM